MNTTGPRAPGAQPSSGRSRVRRWAVIGIPCVLVLVVLLVVANVLVTGYVKDSVEKVLRCVTGDETMTPDVTLGEQPMLVDLVSREVDQITISGLSAASMAPGASDRIPAGDLSITLRGVGLADPPTMESAQASLRLPWAGMGDVVASASGEEFAGATMGEEDGLLSVTLPENVGGQPVRVLVNLEPDGSALTVTPEAVVVGGRRIGVGLVSLLAGDLLKDENNQSRLKPRSIDLELPEGATLTSAEALPAGLALELDIDPAMVHEQGAAGRNCTA